MLPEKPKDMTPQLLDPNRGKNKKSRKQEDRVASKVGGRRVSGSGNQMPAMRVKSGYRNTSCKPGDVNAQDFLMEAKRTDAGSIRITGDMLTKIEAQAAMKGRLPALAIEIGAMLPMTEKDWVMMPLSVFNQLTGKREEEE
jgi:hypothetical protein